MEEVNNVNNDKEKQSPCEVPYIFCKFFFQIHLK